MVSQNGGIIREFSFKILRKKLVQYILQTSLFSVHRYIVFMRKVLK